MSRRDLAHQTRQFSRIDVLARAYADGVTRAHGFTARHCNTGIAGSSA